MNIAQLDEQIALREARHEELSRITINAPTSDGKKPIVRRADTVIEQKLEALWYPVLWIGYPTLLVGEPGLSKSTVTVDIAARISRGDKWPGSETRAKRANVLFLSAEDHYSNVVKPRLRLAGADMTRIYFFDGLRNDEGKESDITLIDNMQQLDATIGELGITLVIVDPVSAYEGRTDSHKNSEVRAMFKQINRVATRRKCAFLLVSHFNKSTNQSGAQRIVGSIAYAAAVRAAFAVVPDETDTESRLMLPAKLNFAPGGCGYRYRVEAAEDYSKIVWSDERVTDHLNDVLHAARKPKRELCIEFLERALADGEVEAEELKQRANRAGYGLNLIYEALKLPKFQKSGGGNQHTKAMYRLVPSGVTEISDKDWLG